MTAGEAPLDGMPRLNTIYDVPEERPQKMDGEGSSILAECSLFLDWLLHSGIKERWKNYAETIKSQATVLYQNSVNVSSKSSFSWSTNDTVLGALMSKSVRKQDNSGHW